MVVERPVVGFLEAGDAPVLGQGRQEARFQVEAGERQAVRLAETPGRQHAVAEQPCDAGELGLVQHRDVHPASPTPHHAHGRPVRVFGVEAAVAGDGAAAPARRAT